MSESNQNRRFGQQGIALAALALLVAFGSGCGDDGLGPALGSVEVQAVDVGTGAPQAGVKLALMDPTANRLLAAPAATGADGRAVWTGVPVGDWPLIVLPGPGRALFAAPAAVTVRRPPPRPGTPPREVLTAAFAEDPLPRVSGLVTDAVTGAPLAGVWVGPPSFLTAYWGRGSPRLDLTLADGRFACRQLPFAFDPRTDVVVMVEPLVFQAEGYRPVVWRTEPPPGDDAIDIADVAVALTPLDPDVDRGALIGRVVFRGAPVAGLPVAASYVADPEASPAEARAEARRRLAAVARLSAPSDPPVAEVGAGLPGSGAPTGAGGDFRLEGLAPGWYLAHPGPALGDGFLLGDVVGPRPPGVEVWPDPVLVPSGGEADLGLVPVLRAITLLEPQPGARDLPPTPVFGWSAVAEADSYLVTVGRLALPTTVATREGVPEDTPLQPGFHAVTVTAFTADYEVVGRLERQIYVEVAGE